MNPPIGNQIPAAASHPFAPAARLAIPRKAAPTPFRRWGLMGCGVLAASALAAGGVSVQNARREAARSVSMRELPMRPVARVDFASNMTAGGRVESRKNTVINCELERMSVSNEGRTISASGNALVLDVVAEGSKVKKGDILCRLNSSDYDELVRTQLMKTQQAEAALEQARLSLGVAQLAVEEYQKGLAHQNVQEMEGQIALAESDLERAGDRLRWTVDMLGKGYVPVAQRSSAERSLAQLRHKLLTSRWSLRNFRQYGDPRSLKKLEAEVEMRRYEVTANEQRVTRLNERLGHYRKMVDACTVRSPHDGTVIYAVNPWQRNAPRLEPGVEVYQQQPLFYLPDLTDMEVTTYLHESVAQKVVPGMIARVKIEGLGNQMLTGKVASVAPLPVSSPTWTTDEAVKFFVAKIKLDHSPEGLLPAMSAEVVIDLERSEDVLAVPTEAVALEQGREVCYVVGSEGLERREVTLGRSNTSLLEVTRGLAEGEEVVINPARVEAIDSLVVQDEDKSEPSPGPGAGGPVGVE